jgi:hypothetical protein
MNAKVVTVLQITFAALTFAISAMVFGTLLVA